MASVWCTATVIGSVQARALYPLRPTKPCAVQLYDGELVELCVSTSTAVCCQDVAHDEETHPDDNDEAVLVAGVGFCLDRLPSVRSVHIELCYTPHATFMAGVGAILNRALRTLVLAKRTLRSVLIVVVVQYSHQLQEAAQEFSVADVPLDPLARRRKLAYLSGRNARGAHSTLPWRHEAELVHLIFGFVGRVSSTD